MAGGGSSFTSGYTYFGGVAVIICAGEITRLTRIANGQTVVWQGDLDQTSRDAEGKTAVSTSLGLGYVYWGRADEQPNRELEAALVDYGSGPKNVPIPAWRHMAKFIIPDCQFGQQPSPPVLTFDFERHLGLLPISAHVIQGDAVLPEVIYDLLQNSIYSVGADPAMLDRDSFSAACETVIAEGIGASPQLDDQTTLRDFIGTLLQYIDGVLRYELGKVKCKLLRAGETPIPIADADLLDEPVVTNESLSDTWNFTRLTFNDRENNWDRNAVEPWDDPANAALQGENITKDIDLPFVTRRAVAKILARRRGIAGGMPVGNCTLKLKPKWRSLRPGDLVSLTHDKLGLGGKQLRVQAIETDGSRNREVTVEAVTEIARDDSLDYIPPDDPIFNIGSFYDQQGGLFGTLASAPVRLLWLPPKQKTNDGHTYADGFAVFMARPSASITRRQVWWTWDPNQHSYHKLDGGKNFPVELTVLGWTRVRNNTRWMLRVQFQSQDDAEYLTGLIADGKKTLIVAARRLYKSGEIDQHQADGLWFYADNNGRCEPVEGLIYDIECTDSAENSSTLSLESPDTPGNYPCATAYAGKLRDLFCYRSDYLAFERNLPNGGAYWSNGVLLNRDTQLVRWIKVLFGTQKEIEKLEDATPVTFDRDNTTMCPNGTYSVQWGNRVPTLYEAYDLGAFANASGAAFRFDALIADLDAALFATAFGIASEDQAFISEATDNLLGCMAQTGQTSYTNLD